MVLGTSHVRAGNDAAASRVRVRIKCAPVPAGRKGEGGVAELRADVKEDRPSKVGRGSRVWQACGGRDGGHGVARLPGALVSQRVRLHVMNVGRGLADGIEDCHLEAEERLDRAQRDAPAVHPVRALDVAEQRVGRLQAWRAHVSACLRRKSKKHNPNHSEADERVSCEESLNKTPLHHHGDTCHRCCGRRTEDQQPREHQLARRLHRWPRARVGGGVVALEGPLHLAV